jgi:tetratricopeptide (TPR) repeat protein
MGILEWQRGNYPEALAHYEEGLAIYRAAGDAAGECLMHNSIGVTYRAMGRADRAIAVLENAIDVERRTEQPLLEGHALGVLAELREERSELERAHDGYTRSLAIRRELGDRRGEGWMLCGLGRIHLARGEADAARAAANEAAAIARECADAELAVACERLRRAPGP